MKKLNNKGFAISTMLYSLLIMVFLIMALLMGIMASNRQNNKTLINTIEDELNRFSLTSTEFVPNSSSSGQEYIVPFGQAGWYKIELWGAAGASSSSAQGGSGAYTSGIIYLEENTLLFFYVGGKGSGRNGGANGGGAGNGDGRGGGGATDVRLVGGAWNNTDSLNSRIMVAGGGGGAYNTLAGQNAATLEGYTPSNANDGKSGTQISGGASTQTNADAQGQKGIGGKGYSGGSGGGAGYYGGGGGKSNRLGGGGSSFISGYAGVGVSGSYKQEVGITAKYFMNGTQQEEYLYFIDGVISENANTGTGKAKIQQISSNTKDNPPEKNTNDLNEVRYIRDCLSGIGSSTKPQWFEIQAIKDGKNIAFGKNTTYPELTDGKLATSITTGKNASGVETTTAYNQQFCQTIDLGAIQSLDEIAVWHNSVNTTSPSERTLLRNTIHVSTDQAHWVEVRNVASSLLTPEEEPLSGPEDTSGIHISAWDVDTSENPPSGTYYIYSALLPNSRLLTAQSKYTDPNNDKYVDDGNMYILTRPVSFKSIDGSNLQKWVITKVTDSGGGGLTWYKILEKESQQALQISDNNGANGSQVNTSSGYSDAFTWTHWDIIALKDGTYRIKPQSQPNNVETKQTYLAVSDNNYTFQASAGILKTYSPTDLSQRFYIVDAGD